MRTFEHFPKDSICPICGKNTDIECILIPIADSDNSDDNCVEAQPFHTDCIQKSIWYYKQQGFVICKTIVSP